MGGGVAGSLGEGGVELRFGIGVIGAAGGRRRTGRGRSTAGEGGRIWQTLFGQRMATGAFGHSQGVGVAADDEDLGVKVGLVDGCQGAGEEFAVEGVALLGRDAGGQAALALGEGLDGDNCPQTHFRGQWLESNGYTLYFPFRGLVIGANHSFP